MTRRILLWMVGLLAIACGSIIAQDRNEPTARELFYGASSSKKPAPVASAGSPSRNPKAGAPSATPNGAKNTPKSNRTPSGGDTGRQSASAQTVVPPPDSDPESSVSVSRSNPVLGLRYSVLKRTATGQFAETDVNTIFRSGDGMRVSIEPNDDGYLYIVNKGSSGTWSLLFPSPEINGGSNRVQAHQKIEVPSRGQFTFVDEPGEERLFVVLSRPPETDLEQLVYSLARVDQPEKMAARAINDELVGKLRSGVLARDLMFETISNKTSATDEQATYIVNVNGSSASRVVADLSLQHK